MRIALLNDVIAKSAKQKLRKFGLAQGKERWALIYCTVQWGGGAFLKFQTAIMIIIKSVFILTSSHAQFNYLITVTIVEH